MKFSWRRYKNSNERSGSSLYPLKPIMDNLYLETFWFFVPNRILWQHWVNFQGEQANPGDSVAYTIPVLDRTKAPLSTTGFTNQSL